MSNQTVTELRVGDKISITFVGTLFEVNNDYVTLKSEAGNCYFWSLSDRDGRTIEIIEKAKPEWQEGDIVVVDDSSYTTYGELRVFKDGRFYTMSDEDPKSKHKYYQEQFGVYRLVARNGKMV